MNIVEIQDFYEYNRWAHERCLDAAVEMSSAQYNEKLLGSFSSLRLTLEHLLATEVVWLSRWEGHSLGDPPDYGGCKDATSLRSLWNSFWHRQQSYLQSLTEEDLSQLVAIRTRSGIETVQPLRDTLVHVVNHSSYHRGQIATQIRQLGAKPPTTDYFIYCLGRSGEQRAVDLNG